MTTEITQGNLFLLTQEDEYFIMPTFLDENTSIRTQSTQQSNLLSMDAAQRTDEVISTDCNQVAQNKDKKNVNASKSILQSSVSDQQENSITVKSDAYKQAQIYVQQQGMSLRQAASLCKIPKSTLARYLSRGGPPVALGRRTILPTDQYAVLTRYILDNPYKAPAELFRIFPALRNTLTRKQLESVKRNTLSRVNALCRFDQDSK